MRRALLTAAALLIGVAGCDGTEDDLTAGVLVFSDDFSAPALGAHWHVGSVHGPASKGGGTRSAAARAGHWKLAEGALSTTGERNQPLWLTRPLPRAVRVEVTATSRSKAGDIKLEIFGDGERHESGYIAVLGGWNNATSVIARRDEHQKDRVERPGGVDVGRSYRLALVRKKSELRFYVDGRLYLRYDDPDPLTGPGHDRFALNNWSSRLTFDDVAVYDLDR